MPFVTYNKTVILCILRWGAGVVICLGQGADMHMAKLIPLPLTISCASKSILVLSFWYWLIWVYPDKGLLNWCCCMQFCMF